MSNLEPISQCMLRQELRSLLPDPVREETQLDGTLVLIGGYPGEVVVRIHGSRATVAVFAIVWEGPHTSVVRPMSLGSLNWRRLPASSLLMAIHQLIKSARELRLANYKKCERCGETMPPEWMHDGKTCQSCAERYLGVVH